MSRYQHTFSRLAEQQQGAFVPFVTIGDPDLALSFKIIQQLVESGADALELGIPFSDPIADGPVIQAANIRALSQQVKPKDCLALISKVRATYPDLPIGLLLYSNLMMARGLDLFYQDAKAAGVDSILVADVPLRESKRFRQAAKQHDIEQIFIATPNADDDTLRTCASYGRGYTYLLSRAGVTGTENTAQMPTLDIITRLQSYHAAPPLLGFGISTPEHVKTAINAGAAGVICGSAIVKIIETHLEDTEQLLSALDKFVSQMKQATIYQQPT